MQKPEQDQGKESQPDVKASLEKVYFLTYLKTKGLTEESLKKLPKEEANRIRREAALYASTKLAEQESQAKFVHNIHGHNPGP